MHCPVSFPFLLQNVLGIMPNEADAIIPAGVSLGEMRAVL